METIEDKAMYNIIDGQGEHASSLLLMLF